MKIRDIPIEKVRDNPWRNFSLDPINDERVSELALSIRLNGLMEPFLVRQTPDGHYELSSRHHRLRSCIKLGMKTVPVEIRDIGDFEMWRMGAAENGLQRGTHVSAATDACAGGIRLVAGYAMLGKDEDLAEVLGCQGLHNCGDPRYSAATQSPANIRAAIESGKGVGTPTILKLCEAQGVGFPRRVITEAMATLKADGEIGHDAIIRQVADEVADKIRQDREAAEREAEDAKRRAEEAESARVAAEERAKKAAEEERRLIAEAEQAKAKADAKRKAEADEEVRKASKRRAEEDAARDEAKSEAKARKADAEVKTKTAKAAEKRSASVQTIQQKEAEHTYDSRCASVFANDYQNEIYRRYVTDERIAQAVPVDRQYELAKEYAAWVKKNANAVKSGEVAKAKPKTGQTDTTRMSEGSLHVFMGLVMDKIGGLNKDLDKQQKAIEAQRATLEKQMQVARDDVLRGIATASGGLARYRELVPKWPSDEPLPAAIGAEFVARLREFNASISSILKSVKG